MNEPTSFNQSAPAPARDALHGLRRSARWYARIALIALYGAVAALMNPDKYIAGVAFCIYISVALFAIRRTRLWWKLEPGRESFYWYCVGWGELAILLIVCLSAFLLPAT